MKVITCHSKLLTVTESYWLSQNVTNCYKTLLKTIIHVFSFIWTPSQGDFSVNILSILHALTTMNVLLPSTTHMISDTASPNMYVSGAKFYTWFYLYELTTFTCDSIQLLAALHLSSKFAWYSSVKRVISGCYLSSYKKLLAQTTAKCWYQNLEYFCRLAVGTQRWSYWPHDSLALLSSQGSCGH